MRKIIILLLTFLSFITVSYAINATDTNYIDFYQKEYNRVYKNYEKNPNSIEAMVDMANFYSAPNNPMRNYSNAITYITNAESKYIALVNDNSKYKEVNKLIKRKITISSIRKQKQYILDKASQYIESSNMSMAECEDYIKAFGAFPSIKQKIEKVQSRLAYNQCLNVNTISAYVTFAKQYPNSEEQAEALKKAQQYILSNIENSETEEKVDVAIAEYTNDTIAKYAMKKKAKIAYRNTIKINTIEAYKTFLSQYPASDEYVLALDKIDKLLYNDFSNLKTPRDYAIFAQNNTESPLADQALDTIINMILTNRNLEALDIYLSLFPLDHRYNDVFQTYYRWHTIDGSAAPIEYFASQYPNYPFTYSLTDDLQRTRSLDSLNLTKTFNERNLSEYISFIRNSMKYGVAYVALQRMVQNMIKKQQWNDAVKRIQSQSICFEDANAENYNNLIELLKAPVDKKQKITNAFSPKYSVMNIAITKDGNKCYYTKMDNKSGVKKIATAKNIKGRWVEDNEIMFTNIDNIGIEIFSIFDNDTKMLIGKDGDIAEAVYETENDKWTLVSIFPYPINSDGYDGDAYMIPDGSGMLIASDRRNGMNLQPSKAYFHGDTALASDIFFVPRKNNVYGWDDAINLGIDINTIYCERAPILSRDLKTLYFCTDGHGGLGYCDVYMTNRLSTDSWTKWSKPQNIGKIANTGFNEISLALSPDEKKLYIITDRNGKYEAYSISLNNSENNFKKEIDVYCTKKNNTDKTDKIILNVWDIDTRMGNTQYVMNENKAKIEVFKNKKYVVFSQLKEHFLSTCFIDEFSPNQIEIECYKISDLQTNNTTLPLHIGYLSEKTDIMDDNANLYLDYLFDFLNTNPNVNIEIISNVNLPSLEESYYISLNRSNSIKKYLVEKGIDKNRIISSGFGNVNYNKENNTHTTEIRFL